MKLNKFLLGLFFLMSFFMNVEAQVRINKSFYTNLQNALGNEDGTRRAVLRLNPVCTDGNGKFTGPKFGNPETSPILNSMFSIDPRDPSCLALNVDIKLLLLAMKDSIAAIAAEGEVDYYLQFDQINDCDIVFDLYDGIENTNTGTKVIIPGIACAEGIKFDGSDCDITSTNVKDAICEVYNNLLINNFYVNEAKDSICISQADGNFKCLAVDDFLPPDIDTIVNAVSFFFTSDSLCMNVVNTAGQTIQNCVSNKWDGGIIDTAGIKEFILGCIPPDIDTVVNNLDIDVSGKIITVTIENTAGQEIEADFSLNLFGNIDTTGLKALILSCIPPPNENTGFYLNVTRDSLCIDQSVGNTVCFAVSELPFPKDSLLACVNPVIDVVQNGDSITYNFCIEVGTKEVCSEITKVLTVDCCSPVTYTTNMPYIVNGDTIGTIINVYTDSTQTGIDTIYFPQNGSQDIEYNQVDNPNGTQTTTIINNGDDIELTYCPTCSDQLTIDTFTNVLGLDSTVFTIVYANGNPTTVYTHNDTGGGGEPRKCPVAIDDQGTTQPDTPITIDICANDANYDDPITEVVFKTGTQTGTGVYTNNGDCTITYTSGVEQMDTISYCIIDADGDTSNVAEIVVNVSDLPPVGVYSDLRIKKNASIEYIGLGDTIDFTIKVWNDGPDDEPNFVVEDKLSPSLNLLGTTCNYVGDIWTGGALAVGDSSECVITVVVNTLTDIANQVKVDGINSDPNSLNNSDIAVVTAPLPPTARIFATNPNDTGLVNIDFDMKVLSSDVPCGECSYIEVYRTDTLTGNEFLYETISGLTCDPVTSWTTDLTGIDNLPNSLNGNTGMPDGSVLDHMDGIIESGSQIDFHKSNWAFSEIDASGATNGGANASKLNFKVFVGGTCTGNTNTTLPVSTNPDNQDDVCKISNYAFDNHIWVDGAVIIGENATQVNSTRCNYYGCIGTTSEVYNYSDELFFGAGVDELAVPSSPVSDDLYINEIGFSDGSLIPYNVFASNNAVWTTGAWDFRELVVGLATPLSDYFFVRAVPNPALDDTYQGTLLVKYYPIYDDGSVISFASYGVIASCSDELAITSITFCNQDKSQCFTTDIGDFFGANY